MKIITNKIMLTSLLLISGALVFTACNKDVQQFAPITTATSTGISSDSAIRANPDDSLYYRMIVKAGLVNTFKLTTGNFTYLVPNNNAMRSFINAASGGLVPLAAPDAVFSSFITSSLPAASANGIVNYNIIAQQYPSSSIVTTFPNMQLGSQIFPSPSAPWFAVTNCLSKRGSLLWANNVPIVSLIDAPVVTGIVHHTAAVVVPPSQLLWDRIGADADMTIFKAAVLRADSGTIIAPATTGTLVTALLTGPANFTVFVPTNLAMKQYISALTGGLLPVAAPDANFIAFLNSAAVTTKDVKGIIVYHITDGRSSTLSPATIRPRPGRIFSVNLPTAPTSVYTLLNSADSIGISYPPIALAATFNASGTGVTAATVKGALNPAPVNILINPTPAPSGTSDQLYVNGVLFKTDGVIRIR